MDTLQRHTPTLFIGSAIVLALALVLLTTTQPSNSHAVQQTTMHSYQEQSANRQTTGDTPSTPSDDAKVAVQTWTIMAAGGAAAVGLLLFFLRIALGRVPPPPPQEEAPH